MCEEKIDETEFIPSEEDIFMDSRWDTIVLRSIRISKSTKSV